MSGISEIRSVIMQGDIARKNQEPGASSHHDTHQAVVAQQYERVLEKRQVTVQLSEEAQNLRSEEKKEKEKKDRRKTTGATEEPEDAGEQPAEDVPERLDVRA